MNPILQNYIQRYIDKSSQTQNSIFPKFFTQYDLGNYDQFLPYLFEIEAFCLRLFEALICDDQICIYSDYDTDAMTATGVMYWGLIDLGFEQGKLSFYAPDRFVEGYGMNTDAVAKLILENDLIISVDCGINSVLEAQIVLENYNSNSLNDNPNQKLNQNSKIKNDQNTSNLDQNFSQKLNQNKKCELIITDHHHLGGQIPDCVAVVNPRLCDYWTNPENSTKLTKIQNKLQIQSEKLAKIISNKLENPKETNQKISNWLIKMNKKLDFKDLVKENPKEDSKENLTKNSSTNTVSHDYSSSQNYLSSSTTGVGVAWFSLVWFGYFLKELE